MPLALALGDVERRAAVVLGHAPHRAPAVVVESQLARAIGAIGIQLRLSDPLPGFGLWSWLRSGLLGNRQGIARFDSRTRGRILGRSLGADLDGDLGCLDGLVPIRARAQQPQQRQHFPHTGDLARIGLQVTYRRDCTPFGASQARLP